MIPEEHPKRQIALSIKPYKDEKHPLLTIMIGPSGAGKSTKARQTYPVDTIISTDQIREHLCGDLTDQSRNAECFEALYALLETRLRAALPTVVDATNLRQNYRKKLYEIHTHCLGSTRPVIYHVVNRPQKDKVKTGGWRNAITVKDKSLMSVHEEQFQSNLQDILNGDGYPNVKVRDDRTS